MKKRIFVLCLSILFSSLSLLTAQSLWQLKNPSFFGYGPNEGFFISDTKGWIIGGDETIFFTENGAQTWEPIYIFTNDYIQTLVFVNEHTGFAGYGNLYKTNDGGYSWEKLFLNPPIPHDYRITKMFFIDEQVGWICSNYKGVYKTSDGGNSWTEQLSDSNYDIRSIYFVDENTGWIIYRYGTLVSTSDGGNTWQVLHEQTSMKTWNEVIFTDEMTGWITVSQNYLLKTTDGGITLDTVFVPTEESLIGTMFYNNTEGVTYTENYLFRTQDAGQNWETIPFPLYHKIDVAFFPTPQFVCALNGGIDFSNDGGYNWDSPTGGFYEDVNGVSLTPEGTLFIVGNGGLIKRSEDKGDTWVDLDAGISKGFFDVFFVSENEGWICGEGGGAYAGGIYSTSDGGDTWVLYPISTSVDILSIFFVDPLTGYFAGQAGVVYKTENGGQDWQELDIGGSATIYDIYFLDPDQGWLVYSGGLLKTTDGGESFEYIEIPDDDRFRGVYFANSQKGWVTGRHYVNYTEDGGQTWSSQYSDDYNLSIFLNDITFSDPLHGWICGRNGLFLHTTDGGMNWVPHSSYRLDLLSLVMKEYEVFAVGEDGAVLYNDNASFLSPGIVAQSTDTIICEGPAFNLFVEAIGDSLQYQWYNTNVMIPDATNDTLHFSAVEATDGGLYVCEINNRGGSINSEKIIMSVKPKITITGITPVTAIHVGDSINLIAGASGALPIIYKWQRDGNDILGLTYNAYPIYGAQYSDSGYYRCIVSNDCSVDTTALIKVTVMPPSAVNEHYPTDLLITLYPNPANSILNIAFNSQISSGTYEVFDLFGQSSFSGDFTNTSLLCLETASLDSGIYLIRLMIGKETYFHKFVRE